MIPRRERERERAGYVGRDERCARAGLRTETRQSSRRLAADDKDRVLGARERHVESARVAWVAYGHLLKTIDVAPFEKRRAAGARGSAREKKRERE